MNEQKTTEGEESETAEKDNGAGDKYETTPVIERAREAAERMEKATANQKVENDRAEAIMAKRALGGETEAGQKPVEEEETPEQYVKKVMNGEIGDDKS